MLVNTLKLTLALALALAGCDKPGSTSPEAPTRGKPDQAYTARGQIEMLPDPAKPTAEFIVHHEPIPSFVNPSGTLGMSSMSMPFPVQRGISLKDLAVGDPIEFDFAVWTTPGLRGFEITRIKKLPPSTKLEFGSVKPEAPALDAKPASSNPSK